MTEPDEYAPWYFDHRSSVYSYYDGDSNAYYMHGEASAIAETTLQGTDYDYPQWYFDQRRSVYWYFDRDSNAYYLYGEGSEKTQPSSTESQDAYPSWYYDNGRSLYWYYCKESNAYHMHGEPNVVSSSLVDYCQGSNDFHENRDSKELGMAVGVFEGGQNQLENSALCMIGDRFILQKDRAFAAVQPQQNDNYCTQHVETYEASNQKEWDADNDRAVSNGPMFSPEVSLNDLQNLETREKSTSVAEEIAPQLTSGWVEDTLIEFFLTGYSNVECNPGISSADIFSDSECHSTRSPPRYTDVKNDGSSCQPKVFCVDHQSTKGNLSSTDPRKEGADNSVDNVEYTLGNGVTVQGTSPSYQRSDAASSEELEEGEWLSQDDENKSVLHLEKSKELCHYDDHNRGKHGETIAPQGLICERCECPLPQLDCAINSESAEEDRRFQNFSESNEAVEKISDVPVYFCKEENSDEDQRDVELWQAQYGQVTKADAKERFCSGAISLWNWRTAVQKVKDKRQRSIRLVGQIAPTLHKLHPSLQCRDGLIKTSAVCEVDLDLVKVSSGELYRLRQPSSKYLASVRIYDSSNPTKDWDFPRIGLGIPEHFESDSKDSLNKAGASKFTQCPLVAKPFVPNMGHLRYQSLTTPKQRIPPVPADLRVMTAGESASLELRKQSYRDRAKERRSLHGGFGIGFGQRLHDCQQGTSEISPPVDVASESGNLLATNTVAKRMLESMGWSQGESLGKRKDGLIEPLQGIGNAGRSGIGWKSSSDYKLVKTDLNPSKCE